MIQKNNHGLPLLRVERPETQETHFINLSEAQSTSLVKRVKQIGGPDSNITHLGHAAMVLALLRSTQLTSSSSTSPQPLYSPCWLNGRRYLRTSDANPFPTQDYIPLCISFAPIIFHDLEKISLSRSANRAAIKSKLIKACKIATEQYGSIKKQKSILPECVLLFESFGEKMRYLSKKASNYIFSVIAWQLLISTANNFIEHDNKIRCLQKTKMLPLPFLKSSQFLPRLPIL